jgi:transmembrane sensor
LPQSTIRPVPPGQPAPVESSVEAAGLKTYVTAPGERSTIRLIDGSSVILNTSSKLRVQFTRGERRLYLESGQAFFDVAKDAGRPFRVFAGTDEVRAVGTAFEVQRLGDGARVVLTRGKVALYRYERIQAPRDGKEAKLDAARPIAVMVPGQAATLDRAEPVRLARVDLVKAEAWKSGRLILEGEPLDAAVTDINRYGGPQIKLADPSIAKFKVSGVFHTANSEEFADSVTAVLPVRVAKRTETELILAPR